MKVLVIRNTMSSDSHQSAGLCEGHQPAPAYIARLTGIGLIILCLSSLTLEAQDRSVVEGVLLVKADAAPSNLNPWASAMSGYEIEENSDCAKSEESLLLDAGDAYTSLTTRALSFDATAEIAKLKSEEEHFWWEYWFTACSYYYGNTLVHKWYTSNLGMRRCTSVRPSCSSDKILVNYGCTVYGW